MTNPIAQSLEQHFDVAFSAPNGIKKLRELILTLAMQGKLVPQDANDTPASELLKDIASEKARLVSEGKIKKQKPLPAIPDDEKPYDLPQGWKWVRLGDVCSYIQRGKSPSYASHSEFKVISQKCVRWHGLDIEPCKFITPESLEKYEDIRFLQENDLLWNSTGTGTIGRACLVPMTFADSKLVADSHVTVVRSLKINKYLLLNWIKTSFVQDKIEATASGSTNQIELNTSTVTQLLFPLPPLAEQHRIVAKIDQLMARCDALEALQQAKEAQRLSVHQAAIRQLLDAEHTHTAWQFLQTHFAELYSVKANVSELRKAILQLAVMGILLPKTSDWSTKKLKMLTTKIGSGSTPSGGKEAYQMSGIPLIRSMNVHFEGFSYKGLAYIDESQAEKLKNVIVQENDVLLNITGASIGRVTVAPREMMGARVNQHVCIIRLNEQVEPKFLVSFLSSPLIQNMINDVQVGATREALTKGMIEQFDIPLPSLSEQHRIVAKIDQLMSLCDNLEEQIDASQAKQSELLAALMSGV